MVRAERLVSKLVEEAKESAGVMRRRQAQRDKDLLQEIILSEALTPVYQPIVHLDSGEIFGFEALTPGCVVRPVQQGGVVALALHLDDEREPRVEEVDPAHPCGIAEVDLASERSEQGALGDVGEPGLEP